jgi:hypothetical protein
MADSKRARSWKRRTQPRIDLTNAEPVLYSTHDSAEKPVSEFFSFVQLRSLAYEPEFVARIDFPFHHFPWLNINGSSEREWQVHITL